MAYLTAGGFACIRGRVTLPRIGLWVADVAIEPTSAAGAAPAVGGHVTVTVGGVALAGTVRRAQNAWGTVLARIVGGGGGLPAMLAAKPYRQVPARMPLSDLLGECREQLSPTSDPVSMGQQLAFWVRQAGRGYVALAALVEQLGVAWRALPDGSLWFGAELWPGSSAGKPAVVAYEPQELRMVLYLDTPAVFPGQTFDGLRVSAVTHVVEPERVRTEVLFEDPALESA